VCVSYFVFFSGSPLDPDLLRNCAVTKLRVILIDERLANPGVPLVLAPDRPAVVRKEKNKQKEKSLFSKTTSPTGSCAAVFCAGVAGRSRGSLLTHGIRQVKKKKEYFACFSFCFKKKNEGFLFCVVRLKWRKIIFFNRWPSSPIRKKDCSHMPSFWSLSDV
jgi:hypothetical protein